MKKIQYLKVSYKNSLYYKCADKYKARKYVTSIIDSDILVPIYGYFNCVDELLSSIPKDPIIIKGTHGSGFNYIIRDISSLDKDLLYEKLSSWINTNYYHRT